jgi:hypothetical protein
VISVVKLFWPRIAFATSNAAKARDCQAKNLSWSATDANQSRSSSNARSGFSLQIVTIEIAVSAQAHFSVEASPTHQRWRKSLFLNILPLSLLFGRFCEHKNPPSSINPNGSNILAHWYTRIYSCSNPFAVAILFGDGV